MNRPTEEWQMLNELFEGALALETVRRRAYVEQACGGNPRLRERLEKMLAAHEHSDGFLETPVIDAIPDLQAEPETRLIGQRIGKFRIERLIASGGMGTVYEATQDQPRRAVALKVMKQGFPSPSLRKRFEVEAQVLGRLQHPGIAQIFEAGTADLGAGPQPFFVMELIDGQSLLDHTTARQLSTRERLESMVQICEAVQHAHHKGVIHRDLKPANIMVDQAGRPKILDFGVARATDADIQVTTLQTDVGQLIGTLPYMSPEQVTGDPGELDTRSDVYSLGVVCYELLSGRLPHELRHKPLPEAARLIREEDHTPLSSVDRVFRGDLDTIISKALEKDKDRRYQSAQEFADDLKRFLSDEPIVARAPSTLYQLGKFSRRHKALVGGAASTFVILIIGVISTSMMAMRAYEETENSKAVTAFLKDVFLYIDPLEHGQEVKLIELIDRAARGLETNYADRPDVAATLHNEIGTTYYNLSLYESAEAHFRKSYEIRQRRKGENDPQTLDVLNNLGLTLQKKGNPEEGEPLLRQALAGRRSVLGPEHHKTLVTMNNLALCLLHRGQNVEGRELLERALAIQQRVLGEHTETFTTMNNLAQIHAQEQEYEVAERLYRQSLEGLRRTLGEDHSTTLIATGQLAKVLKEQDKFEEAEPLYRRYLQGLRARLSDQHADTLIAMGNLAVFLRKRGALEEAESLFRLALDGFRKTSGRDHANTLSITKALARLMQQQKRPREAEQFAREAYAIGQRTTGEADPETIKLMDRLHRLLRQQKKTAEARAVAEQALPSLRNGLGWDHAQTIRVTFRLIKLLREQDEYAAAQAVAEQALPHYREELGSDHPDTLRITNILAMMHQNQDRLAEAELLYRKLAEDARGSSISSEQIGVYLSNHGQCLMRLQRFEEAEVVLLDAHAQLSEAVGPQHRKTRRVLEYFVTLYDDWNKPAQAAEYRALLPSSEKDAPAARPAGDGS